ncbi:cytoplasmic protein [Luteimonas aquatica]|uniref:cytoplasmic protein n=1 Tax=Luteimonas aquatica TaxID=450364 RepID=UPI001F57355A|nr:cytoplasmic protein [Luteimonas aquatica]
MGRVMNDVIQAHRHSSGHRHEIEISATCGCFYCGEIYMPSKIEKWADQGMTAICPICGIDSVIGDASGYPVNKEFLSAMRKTWFW